MVDSGAVASEYAIIAGLIAAVIVIAVAALGAVTVGLFSAPELLDALVP